jgi:hypothetical protein
MAARILNEEIEHEAWFIELLARERDGKVIPSGHFRRGEPGHAPYSKERRILQPIRLSPSSCLARWIRKCGRAGFSLLP